MRHVATSLVASLILALIMADPALAETRALRGFTAIQVSEGVQLDLVQDDTFEVEVTGPDASRIVTTVRGEQLSITRRGFFHLGSTDARVRVSAPHINALNVSAGAQVTVSELTSPQLDLRLSQGATLEARNVQVGELTLSASQGAMVTISGACTSADVRASMGGLVEADALACASATARASMGGSVQVFARDSVDADATMGGAIEVSGSPAARQAKTGMGGAIDFE